MRGPSLAEAAIVYRADRPEPMAVPGSWRGPDHRANTAVSRAEAIKRFRVLPDELAVGAELTGSLKVRREYVLAKFADEITAVY